LSGFFFFRFFNESVSPGPPGTRVPLGSKRILTKIRGNIRNFVFVAGVVATGDKLIAGVADKRLSQNVLCVVSGITEIGTLVFQI
jgi:type IV secretory pathway VirB2 component (pilin)